MSPKAKYTNLGPIDVHLLRKAIGILGFAFPLVLWIGGGVIAGLSLQKSMSRYYATEMHDAFVAIMCTLALGLFAYQGYQVVGGRPWEKWVARIAAMLAAGVAIFPPVPLSELEGTYLPLFRFLGKIGPPLHLACAVLFIIILIWFVLGRFTKTKTHPKRKLFYQICGWTMIVAFVVTIANWISDQFGGPAVHGLVFWGEAFVVWGFGLAWFVKGLK